MAETTANEYDIDELSEAMQEAAYQLKQAAEYILANLSKGENYVTLNEGDRTIRVELVSR